jgi:hypothetical protein
MWKCQKCGELHEDNFDSCWKCGTPVHDTTPRFNVAANEQAGPLAGHYSMSVVPYAILVPVLVVMAQSALVIFCGESFRSNALLAHMSHPVVLGGMTIMAIISFFVIRPFVNRATSRWVAFLSCVVGFTILVESLLPNLAE